MNFKKKILILRYFINTDKINIKKILEKYHLDGFKDRYECDNIENIFENLKSEYNIHLINPYLNEKNENLTCKTTEFICNDKFIEHVKSCGICKYKPWYEEIPKEVLKSMRIRNTYIPPQTVNSPQSVTSKTICNKAYFRYRETRKIKRAFLNELKNIVKLSKSKRQVIYIASTTEMKKMNYFKVGGVKTEEHLKKRLSQYNTGTVKGFNDYEFLFTYLLPLKVSFHEIENELKIRLKHNRIANTEVYQQSLYSLRSQIEHSIKELSDE